MNEQTGKQELQTNNRIGENIENKQIYVTKKDFQSMHLPHQTMVADRFMNSNKELGIYRCSLI